MQRQPGQIVHVIGLTGGIGTGKSEVAATLSRLGAVVIDADEHGHLAYRKGTMGWRRVVELFGSGMLSEDGEIDRRKLGALVFGNTQALAWLNAAIHPLIRGSISKQLADLREQGIGAAVVDAAVLYQAGWDDMTDEVWVVSAPADAVIPRLAEQRSLQEWEVRGRINAQEPPSVAQERADVIIENAGSLEELQAKVKYLWNERISQ